jgi:hypothetical protein
VITQHHVFGALKNEWLAILGGSLVKFHPTDTDIYVRSLPFKMVLAVFGLSSSIINDI